MLKGSRLKQNRPKGVMKVQSLEDCLANSICRNLVFASSFVKLSLHSVCCTEGSV